MRKLFEGLLGIVFEKEYEKYNRVHENDRCPGCGKKDSLFDACRTELDGTERLCFSCVGQLEYESQLEQDEERWQYLLQHSIY